MNFGISWWKIDSRYLPDQSTFLVRAHATHTRTGGRTNRNGRQCCAKWAKSGIVLPLFGWICSSDLFVRRRRRSSLVRSLFVSSFVSPFFGFLLDDFDLRLSVLVRFIYRGRSALSLILANQSPILHGHNWRVPAQSHACWWSLCLSLSL